MITKRDLQDKIFELNDIVVRLNKRISDLSEVRDGKIVLMNQDVEGLNSRMETVERQRRQQRNEIRQNSLDIVELRREILKLNKALTKLTEDWKHTQKECVCEDKLEKAIEETRKAEVKKTIDTKKISGKSKQKKTANKH